MNITNFIVEILKSGKDVEITGVGTFFAQDVAAHHDAERGVFYPDHRGVGFSNATTGDEYVIDAMARRECVSRDIAERMWRSYVEALVDKLQTKGEHSFAGLGTLQAITGGYSFTADPELNLSDSAVRPIENVKRYDTDSTVDPFAAYEQQMTQVGADEQIAERPEVSIPEGYTPAPHVETKPEEQEVAEQKKADEVVPPVEDVSTNDDEVREPETEEIVAEQPVDDDEEDDGVIEVEIDEEEDDDSMSSTIETLNKLPDSNDDEQTTRRSRAWLWILLLLLLLLIGGGAYFYFVYMPAHGGTVESALSALKAPFVGDKDKEAVEQVAVAGDETTEPAEVAVAVDSPAEAQHDGRFVLACL